MSNSFKNILILAMAGIIAFFLITRGCKSRPVEKPVIIPTKDIIKSVEKFEAPALKKIDSLKISDSVAKHQVTDLKGKLAVQQERTRVAERMLNTVLLDIPTDNSPVRPAITDYVETVRARDTLATQIIQKFTDQVRTKDSIISATYLLYKNMRGSFDLVIDQQDKLTKYSNDLKKQVKRKKASAVFWKITTAAAGLFILKQSL